jgi:hypothetical protein
VIHVPATLSILGRKVGVASARMVSAALLFGSLLVLALLLVLGLVARPRAEGDAIRRRYWPLLVPVHPMPAPIGRPVVEVPDFNTLVKVAQRYGLLVMHWARAGIETYVVQDDAITYRYRTGAAGPISEHNPTEGWASPADPATPVAVDDVEPAAVAPWPG